MLRNIFDTNIYGHLIEESDAEELEKKIIAESNFIVYGFAPIRREIRNISTTNQFSRQLRQNLLGLYDRITCGHVLTESNAISSIPQKNTIFAITLKGEYLGGTRIFVLILLL